MNDPPEAASAEPVAGAPQPQKVQVEVKTHADKYSTNDLLVDVSIFKNGEKPLFALSNAASKEAPSARRVLSRRAPFPARPRKSPTEPNVAQQIISQLSAERHAQSEPSQSRATEPWVAGFNYYFLVEQDGVAPFIVKGHTAPPRSGWPSSLRVSLHEKLATAAGLATNTPIHITPVPKELWSQYELDHVELTVLDTFVSRSDMWGAMYNLRHNTFYVGKKVLVSGYGQIGHSVVTVKAMIRRAPSAAPAAPHTLSTSGIVVESTKFTVRSLSARMMMMFQISKEMFVYGTGEEGDIYFSRAVDTLLRDLVGKWKKAGCNHTVTLVLYARLEATGDAIRDFFRPVWQGTGSSDWAKVPQLLKCAVHEMIHDMRATTPIHPADHLGQECAQLSTARSGNTLEAINLALNSLAQHHVDRSLNRTGLTVIVVSAGAGLVRTNKELSRLTAQRILDTGIGCDMICLGRPPLHVSPLFEYHSANSQSFEYERPTWMNVRFYCNDPASVWMTECLLMTYDSARKLYTEAPRFTPQCRSTPSRDGVGVAPDSSGFVHIDASQMAGRRFREDKVQHDSKILPRNYKDFDAQAFKVTGKPIQWDGRADPMSPGAEPRSEHEEIHQHAHTMHTTPLSAPTSRGFATANTWHRRSDSGSLSAALNSTAGHISHTHVWSPQSPTYGTKALPPQHSHHPPHRVSPSKAGYEHFTRRGSTNVGCSASDEFEAHEPQALLIPPFDTTEWRVMDCTNPVLIQHRVSMSLDPFEEANSARWSHMFPQEASVATGLSGPFSGAWKFIIEPAMLPLTSPYYPDADDVQGFEIHHSTKTPSSQGVVPVPPGPEGMLTFLHETIVQRLHQGYQYIPPVVNKTFRLSLGHQFHEISADSWKHSFQQWVHQEYRARQQTSSVLGNHKGSGIPPSPSKSPMCLPSSALPIKLADSGVIEETSSLNTQSLFSRVKREAAGRVYSDGFRGMAPERDEDEHVSPALECTYYLQNPFSRGWDCKKIQFRNESGNVYVNWSGLDQLLSGTQDEADLFAKRKLIDPLFQARKVKYAIVPDSSASEGFSQDSVTRWIDQVSNGSEFILVTKERLNKFSYTQDKLTVEFDIAKVIENAALRDLEGATQQEKPVVDDGVLELVLEDKDSRKGVRLPHPDADNATYQADIPSTPPPVNAFVPASIPLRSPWCVLGISKEAHSRCFLAFSVTWLACPGCKISELIDLCRRRMLQTMGQGYRLVQIPCSSISGNAAAQPDSKSNPFTPHIWIPVLNEDVLRLVVLELLNTGGYLPSRSRVTYNCSLLHVSGEAMIYVPSNETIRRDFGLFFAKNTLATTDMMYLDTSRYNSVNSTVTSYNTSAEIVESLLGDAFDQIFAE